MTQQGKWAGRNPAKDALRHRIWAELERSGAGVGKIWSSIPNFTGAEKAADQLANLSIWQQAQVVKCNPDRAQAAVRLRALQDGKRLYTPVPALVDDEPYLLLDPADLMRRGIPFEDVTTSKGALAHGVRVQFKQMEPIDLALVGCVAVTQAGGRTGKGAGFADLEMGIFREYGWLIAATPIATTVHPIQIVPDDALVMVAHDTPLDWIITPETVIETQTTLPSPPPLDWDALQPDQYRDIPFLRALRHELTGR